MKLSQDLQSVLLDLANIERNAASATSAKVSPEQEELDKLLTERERMHNAAGSAQLAVDDMELEILRIQEDERKLRRRADDDKRQLAAATDEEQRKDLTKDYYTAKSRIGDLLSELAEAHNEIHALRRNNDIHQQNLKDLDRKIESLRDQVASLPEDRSAEENAERAQALRERIPADVLAEYDAQRQVNGVGVARFNGRSCDGCFMVLPPSDISAIRNAPADELPECPDCGSFLIRN